MDIDIDFIDSRKASTVADARLPSRKVSEQEPASFEEAVTATQFGKYNIMLACLAMSSSFCTLFDTSTMSYTFVAAHCDLELTLNDKGLLNAVTYAGMISSAVVWGFLFDVLGRRKLLIIGLLLDAVFVFMSALTQDLPLLLASKYLQGLIINGPFAAVSAYISEFHCAKYRPIYQMIIGTSNSFSSIVLPALAWTIMPQNLDFQLGTMTFHSWNVFLLISGLPAFLSGICFIFFPESPKFLMTCGKNEKALKVFQKVYSINTGQPPETYPIKYLADETKFVRNGREGRIGGQSTKQALRGGFAQLKPIFLQPHVMKLLLTSSIFLFLMMGANMLRLWLPQIFQMMTDYQVDHDGASAALCTILETSVAPPGNETAGECFVNTDNSAIYINSIIVGATAMIGNIVAAVLIRFIRKKKILLVALVSSAISILSMYFATTPEVAIAGSSIFVAGGSVSNNVMISVAVDLFPTTLRTMAISVGMMVGRSGAMIGNFIFSYLLESGCEAPFFVVGSFMLVAVLLTLIIPNTDMKPLT